MTVRSNAGFNVKDHSDSARGNLLLTLHELQPSKFTVVIGNTATQAIVKLICDDIFILHRRKEMHYLTMHSTHFNYGYMASDFYTEV